MDFWTLDKYQKFIQMMEPGTRYYFIFEILFWIGCRIGGKDIITEPKTEQSIRTIDTSELLKIEIQIYVNKLYKYPDDERSFPVVTEAVQHKMKRYIEKSRRKED